MDENMEIMNNEAMEVGQENLDLDEVSSSGNAMNYGIAAVGAAVIGGLIAGGIAIGKRIKAKKAEKTKDEDTEEKATEPEKKKAKKDKKKGIRLGKNKQIIVIDNRKKEEETPAEE